MKKITSILCLLALTVGLLAGCGSKVPENTSLSVKPVLRY